MICSSLNLLLRIFVRLLRVGLYRNRSHFRGARHHDRDSIGFRRAFINQPVEVARSRLKLVALGGEPDKRHDIIIRLGLWLWLRRRVEDVVG
jgi:hypothetical protein